MNRRPTTGPNPWNMTAPDGVIDLFIDILGVIQQHGQGGTETIDLVHDASLPRSFLMNENGIRVADPDGVETLTINCIVTPVGGDLRRIDPAGLPLETLDSSGPGAGVLAVVAAAIAAAAITLSGAAWYARRRWVR